jgi:hypothetical protein
MQTCAFAILKFPNETVRSAFHYGFVRFGFVGTFLFDLASHRTEQIVRITIPAAVITEWWRSRHDARERNPYRCSRRTSFGGPGEVAGQALAAIKGATQIDVIVMASAAQRGDVAFTTDASDLAKFAGYFRAVAG